MRIAITGTANSGKTTIVKSFLHTWENYTTPSKSYRDFIADENLDHSSKTTPETQQRIMDFMIDQQQGHTVDDNIIYDRCPIDCLAYSLWCHEKGIEGFDHKFVTKQIQLMRESMRSLDIVFVCRYNKKLDQLLKKEDNDIRDEDRDYIIEIDNIIESLYQQYVQHPDADVFYPKNDTPAIIALPDEPQARIDMIAEYVTPEGGMYGDDESIFSDINKLQDLVDQQVAAHKQEEEERKLFEKFGLNKTPSTSFYN